MTQASVIVPLYKRVEWIEKCLEALGRQDFRRSFEIIVVDDGSPNVAELSSVLEHFKKRQPNVKFLKKRHCGPAAARNYGVTHSRGNILCFLDDDSLPASTWLQELTSPFGKSENIGIVSGKTLSLDRKEGLALLLEKSVYPAKSWATCNIAYRRDIFETLGGFDESFPEPSWEDNELGLRARWKGYKHIFNDRAIVYHPHECSLDEYKKKCYLNGRGAAAFSRKYLFKKPIWGMGTPVIMGRKIMYAIFPSVWLRRIDSAFYLRFLWSFYSLKGFVSTMCCKK